MAPRTTDPSPDRPGALEPVDLETEELEDEGTTEIEISEASAQQPRPDPAPPAAKTSERKAVLWVLLGGFVIGAVGGGIAWYHMHGGPEHTPPSPETAPRPPSPDIAPATEQPATPAADVETAAPSPDIAPATEQPATPVADAGPEPPSPDIPPATEQVTAPAAGDQPPPAPLELSLDVPRRALRYQPMQATVRTGVEGCAVIVHWRAEASEGWNSEDISAAGAIHGWSLEVTGEHRPALLYYVTVSGCGDASVGSATAPQRIQVL